MTSDRVQDRRELLAGLNNEHSCRAGRRQRLQARACDLLTSAERNERFN
jgi:hypothetical protein